MTLVNYAFLAGGLAIGIGASFADTEFPKSDNCSVYRVARKSAVSYVLKPPSQPAPVFEPPMVTPKEPEIAQVSEINTTDFDVNKTPEIEHETPRRKHRHLRRHRRYY